MTHRPEGWYTTEIKFSVEEPEPETPMLDVLQVVIPVLLFVAVVAAIVWATKPVEAPPVRFMEFRSNISDYPTE